MLVVWLFDLVVWAVGGILDLFPTLPAFDLGSPLNVQVPVPLLPASAVSAMNAWAVVALGVSLALVIGRVLQWFWKQVPIVGGH